MKKVETSWILYDVANSAFVLVVVTTVMPLFFKQYASLSFENSVSTSNWAFANSFAALLVAFSAPILGTIADYQGFKKKFFLFFFALGIIATFLLTTIQANAWVWCLLIYICARIGYTAANIFYDAFLPDIAPPDRMDNLSSRGFAWGYIGSVVPFLAVVALMFTGEKDPVANFPVLGAKIGFVIVGLWWLLLSIPFIKNVTQAYYVAPSRTPVRDSFTRIINTFRAIRQFRKAFLFLLAYFFYIDGVDTIITMATAYGVDIGLGPPLLILAILMIQVVAFPFALLYGRLAEKYSSRNMLLAGIGVYMIITLTAFFLPSFDSHRTKVIVFWILAFLVATSMGGIQALSRSYFGKLIPPRNSAEFFGFYNIFGKFAAIVGPFLMGMVGRMTGETRYGVLSLLILFIVGGILLLKVENQADA